MDFRPGCHLLISSEPEATALSALDTSAVAAAATIPRELAPPRFGPVAASGWVVGPSQTDAVWPIPGWEFRNSVLLWSIPDDPGNPCGPPGEGTGCCWRPLRSSGSSRHSCLSPHHGASQTHAPHPEHVRPHQGCAAPRQTLHKQTPRGSVNSSMQEEHSSAVLSHGCRWFSQPCGLPRRAVLALPVSRYW